MRSRDRIRVTQAEDVKCNTKIFLHYVVQKITDTEDSLHCAASRLLLPGRTLCISLYGTIIISRSKGGH